jgi:ketosteroid isomerase-like protein
MSQENVEIVRAICAPWKDGDFSSSEWAHPDIEFVIAEGPTPGRWTGLAGLAQAWRSYLSAWEGYTAEAEAFMEIDDERILVPHRNRGRGRGSGMDVALMNPRGASVFHIRDGKVTRLVTYVDYARALEELGLSE